MKMEDTEEDNAKEVSESKFSIDISAIHCVQTEDQAPELQSLGLSVFDQNVFEKGVIEQVGKALTGDSDHFLNTNSLSLSDRDEGEVDDFKDSDNSLTKELHNSDGERKSSKDSSISIIEEYLQNQLKLHDKKKLLGSSQKKANTVTNVFKKKKYTPKSQKKVVCVKTEDDKSLKKEKKSSYVGPSKKRKKKEKLGTKVRRKRSTDDPDLQPGEKNYVYLDNSGSEYVPSDDDSIGSSSSAEFELQPKKRIKLTPTKKKKTRRQYLFFERPDTDDSDWDSDEGPKRKGKELDDGDTDLFCRRMKQYEKTCGTVSIVRLGDGFVMPSDIWDQLYDYQKKAVQWFWNLDRQMTGGILGDEMGLGKTIQVIAFLAGLHKSEIRDEITRYEGLGPTLIVCPTTVMHQWVREFHKWYPPIRVAILHESGTYQGKDRSKLIHYIHSERCHGVLITSYNGLVQYQDKIISKEWHYVILDEGHKIRNAKAKVTETAKMLDTPHRIILSGSPLQNNLQELWCLFDFICPGKLGSLPMFIDTFAAPIMQGGYANATQTQVVTAHKCATILKDTITPFLLRRMKEDVGGHINLPEKKEQVLFCRLTDEQRELYKDYLASVDIDDMLRGKAKIFVALINLRKICNHPDLYSGGPKRNFRISSGNDAPKEEHFGYYERAGKMIVIETLLKIWKQQGHRVLVFTQSKKMLLIMEDFVKRLKYKYLKLDGQTTVASRQPLIDKFNKDTSYFVMLLTTKVGGLGVNLTGANRVVIYDPDWNPATDTQARERAWRIGQQRDVTIYRLITAGTIEEKIYHRQIFKQFLSNKILKDPKQRRFFKSNDLLELFTLSETVKNGTTETAAIFAGTGSEIKIPPKEKTVMKQSLGREPISFSQNKIDEMKKLAHMLSKKMSSNISRGKPLGIGASSNNESQLLDPSTDKNKLSTTQECSIYGPDGMIDIRSVQKCIRSNSQEFQEEVIFKTPVENECVSDALQSDLMECTFTSKVGEESVIIKQEHTSTPIDDNKQEEVIEVKQKEIIDIKQEKILDNIQEEIIDIKQEEFNENEQEDTSIYEDKTKEGTPKETKTVKRKVKPKHSTKLKEAVKPKKIKDDKKKKKYREKFASFEGHEVPHLVKKRKYKKPEKIDEEEKSKNQDDYVLRKLFSKGIETAMKHDTIMGGGPSDFAIVEEEADRVAQKALKALKESENQIKMQRLAPLLLNRKKKNGDDLLEIIKRRNMGVDPGGVEKSLLSDMISWLQSQGGTSTTDQIVKEFRPKVGEGKNPLFKAFLGKIAKFYRGPDKVGYWTIRDEYNSPSTSSQLR